MERIRRGREKISGRSCSEGCMGELVSSHGEGSGEGDRARRHGSSFCLKWARSRCTGLALGRCVCCLARYNRKGRSA
jgi:hypothetical protein